MNQTHKGVLAVVGAFAAVVTGIVGLHTLGMPGVVLTTDLDAIYRKMDGLESFSKDTRILVLNGDWWRINAKLEDVREQKAGDPSNRYLRELEQKLVREQRAIEAQIDKLEDSGRRRL